ncbi:phosphatidylglycerophosphatase A [Desulfobaculum xiamenense]|uniref:Phosphatidylglycerophosphatase A n=1 Tax=Desulfobaculum xiamenense TaxID=995050 RepID=A0A846QGK2_9BACT|nr:phosphatidylglycerophosphatase A [Desulfobaculum xiamenense]NJB67361.1 phosphatidylglycerophosphatase A [Desulfobaculum xiamenense]
MTHTSTLDRAATAFATLGPVGHLPKAPGTWGSAVAVIAAPFLFLPFSPLTRCIILAALFVVGGLASGRAETVIGSKDPGCVIIDEVLGQWMVFALFPIMTTWQILLGFALFRLFDITKPWPVHSAETWLPGGFGVMIDDLLAGCYAALCMWGARHAYLAWIAPMMH